MKSILKKFFVRRHKPDSWSIVATVKEPLSLLRAFVAHHLDAGAETVYLYFDDPLDTGFEHFQSVERVEATQCNEVYWGKWKQGRPTDHRRRQSINATRAYKKCTSDWIAHIDADEFLVSKDQIGLRLGKFDANTQTVKVPTVERILEHPYDDDTLVFDGYFKRISEKHADIGQHLFGDAGVDFKHGFQGHFAGKVITRTGHKERRLSIHSAADRGKHLPADLLKDEEICLAHFFPFSFEDWVHKFSRRTLNEEYFSSIPEERQIRYKVYQDALRSGDPKELRKLFEFFSVLSPKQVAILEKNGLLMQIGFDIERKISEFLPDTGSFHCGSKRRLEPQSAMASYLKVFQIGMRNCGTQDLCHQFELRKLNTVCFDKGRIAASIDNAKDVKDDLNKSYADINFFAHIISKDGELFPDPSLIERLAESFPEALFVLNMRSPHTWARSLQIETNASEQRLINTWESHRNVVKKLFANQPARLIEINIDKAKPGFLFDTLDKLGIVWQPK